MAWFRCSGGSGGTSGGFAKHDFTGVTLTANTYIDENNGTQKSSNNWSSTDYIEIQGSEMTFAGGLVRYGSNSKYNAFYDANKTYISGFNCYNDLPVDIPNNAKYMRLSCQTNYFSMTNYYFIG